MRIERLLFAIVSLQLPLCTFSRNWTDIELEHPISPGDPEIPFEVKEYDSLLFTSSPTFASPTALPTPSEPSESPSLLPTITPIPTSEPTKSPTSKPTRSPTLAPTLVTQRPTSEAFPPIQVPAFPDLGYFNYDTRSLNRYGPGQPQLIHRNATFFQVAYTNNGWAKVSTNHYNYWNEFSNAGFGAWKGVLDSHNVRVNVCGNAGAQSPIDLKVTPAVTCREGHQVRSRAGDLSIRNNAEVTKVIMGNKLRLLYARRPCKDLSLGKCREPDPPLGDFPHNWAGLTDLIHIDFKVPSEHTINGEGFDGEYQMFYVHPGRERAPVVSVLIKATKDGFNAELQSALDEFQKFYDRDREDCSVLDYNGEISSRFFPDGNRQRRDLTDDELLKLEANVAELEAERARVLQGEVASSDIQLDDPAYVRYRMLQVNETNSTDANSTIVERRSWDPHHTLLVPSPWFYRYEGSLTEPPCSEFASWFVIDKPMLLSLGQLEQMKRLIFTHVSPSCKATSVHYRESVARPIQDSSGRPVWHCTSVNFGPEKDFNLIN